MRRFAETTMLCVLMAHFLFVACETTDDDTGNPDHGSSASPFTPLSRRADSCASCRGDNSTCRAVSGIFSRPQLNVGYNLVAHIPRGACNLSITEIRKSPNHLALQRRDGSYIFNGDWRLSQSGEYHDAGASFHYRRQDLKSPEAISSAGPINEPLDLMVLYQQPNPIIRYEYLIPIPPAALLLSPEPQYHQRHPYEAATPRPTLGSLYAAAEKSIQAIPSPTSSLALLHQPQQHPALLPNAIYNPYNSIPPFPPKSSGGGVHEISPQAPHLYNTGHVQHTGRHLDLLESRSGKQGQPEKKFYWKVTGYTNCSEVCAGGTQRSIVRCVRAPAGNPVGDRRCSQEEKLLPQVIRCNVNPCPAEWVVVGSWSNCTAECGDGISTRSVVCRQKVSQVLTMAVAEGACLQQKPSTKQSCQLRPCNYWQTTEWSQCSAQCGSGIRKRTVFCVNTTGQRLSADRCDFRDRPTELNPCNMGPCEGADWFVSEWSPECSQTCGTGVQTRHVICSSIKQSQLKSFYTYYSPYQNTSRSSYLKKSRKLGVSSAEIENNLTDEDHLYPVTTPGPADEEIEDASCDESRKPEDERECFSDRNCGQPFWLTGDWGDCSSSCGNGVQTRQVLCAQFTRGKFKMAADSFCSQEDRPMERRSCINSNKCSQRWFTTEWTECSALCGGGTQRRSVSCRASNWTLPSSLCYDLDRPIERRSCNEEKCTLTPVPPTQFTASVVDGSDKVLRDEFSNPSSSGSSYQLSEESRKQVPASTHFSLDMNEEADEGSCTDQYRNCALVVQARLCRYRYYRSVCCRSCSDTL